MEARYRQDYVGEYVLLETRLSQGQLYQKREWIPNLIENHHISGRAAVIGSRIDLEIFDWKRLRTHRGGPLGQKRLQTYGTGDLWRDMPFDFFVTADRREISSISEQFYDQTTTVYSSPKICMENPGRFYLVPYAPTLDNFSLNLYLAAFDNHQEIFLIGYNKETSQGDSWINGVNSVIGAYPSTKFYLVGVASNMPDSWRFHANVRSMTYREFISYCDI